MYEKKNIEVKECEAGRTMGERKVHKIKESWCNRTYIGIVQWKWMGCRKGYDKEFVLFCPDNLVCDGMVNKRLSICVCNV